MQNNDNIVETILHITIILTNLNLLKFYENDTLSSDIRFISFFTQNNDRGNKRKKTPPPLSSLFLKTTRSGVINHTFTFQDERNLDCKKLLHVHNHPKASTTILNCCISKKTFLLQNSLSLSQGLDIKIGPKLPCIKYQNSFNLLQYNTREKLNVWV